MRQFSKAQKPANTPTLSNRNVIDVGSSSAQNAGWNMLPVQKSMMAEEVGYSSLLHLVALPNLNEDVHRLLRGGTNATEKWPFASTSVEGISTRINFIFNDARNYAEAIVGNGACLEAYLNANLQARINPKASEIMDDDLDRLEAHHSSALRNIRAFRSSSPLFEQLVTINTQMTPDLFPQVAPRPLSSAPDEDEPNTLVYWRSVRESLRETFSLNIEALAEAVGVAYATFANLGKTRPKDPTVAKVLRLHELVRALRENEPITANEWLHGEGSRILRESGLEVFSGVIENRIFGKTRMSRPSIVVVDDDSEPTLADYPPFERPSRSGKRI